MIYTNLKAAEAKKHGLFESSRLKATVVGHLYDALVNDGSDEKTPIAVDNGVAICIGEFTGNGLQEVEATIAKATDKIAVVGAPAIVKNGHTKADEQAYNFYVPAGKDAKAYEVVYEDIFAVANYQFTEGSAANIAVGNYVVVDGNGMWVAQTSKPDASAYGFIGKIHSLSYDNLELVTMVRIWCEQNTQIA